MTTEKPNDEFRAQWLSPNGLQAGKSWNQIKRLIESFVDSGKAKLVVQFDTPETAELRAKLARVEELVAALEEIKVKCAESAVDTKSLDCQSLGFMASRRARLALENWRKNE